MLTLNAKLDADSLLYLLSHLNAMATQYTCSLNSIHCPYSEVIIVHIHIPVHSPWLPGYISVMQTILVILTILEINELYTLNG